MMKHLSIPILLLGLTACAASPQPPIYKNNSGLAGQIASADAATDADTANPPKSPHGYIELPEYQPGKFGGFIGDCSNDENWPYYWECMSENSGNNFH